MSIYSGRSARDRCLVHAYAHDVPPRLHEITIKPLPVWLDAARWLGFATQRTAHDAATYEAKLVLSATDAADVAARLRGLGLDGRALQVSIEPPLSRNHVREGRLRDARARRDTTPGFTRTGTRAEGEGRFSLTPEVIALEMAEGAQGVSVLDACCGAGGNAVGFARQGARVTAIELDPERLAEARHNANSYGVADRIHFIAGDARILVPQHRADVLFIDAPWGRDFNKQRTDLASLPLLADLLQHAPRYPELWAKLPASFATAELGSDVRCEAFFGHAAGDRQRIKFVLARLKSA
jgi:SAM-dependent methyltransferase